MEARGRVGRRRRYMYESLVRPGVGRCRRAKTLVRGNARILISCGGCFVANVKDDRILIDGPPTARGQFIAFEPSEIVMFVSQGYLFIFHTR